MFPNEKFVRRQALCWGTHPNLCGPPSKSQWTRIARHTHMLGSAPQLMWDPMSERPRLADAHEYMHGSSWRGTHPNFCGPPVFARWGMHPSLCGTPSLKARGRTAKATSGMRNVSHISCCKCSPSIRTLGNAPQLVWDTIFESSRPRCKSDIKYAKRFTHLMLQVQPHEG